MLVIARNLFQGLPRLSLNSVGRLCVSNLKAMIGDAWRWWHQTGTLIPNKQTPICLDLTRLPKPDGQWCIRVVDRVEWAYLEWLPQS